MGSEARARIALAGLLLATLFCFELVFEKGEYAGPALLSALLGATIAVTGRRLGLSTLALLPLSLAGLVVYLCLIFEARNTVVGIPTGSALKGLTDSLESAFRASQVDFAPVPVRTGYVIAIVVGMWVATTVAELATFRWRNPLLASIGPIALASTALVVGTGESAVVYLVLFLVALLVYWSIESQHRLRSWGQWVHAFQKKDKAEPPSVTGTLARQMGATCLAVTLIAPVFLPGLGKGLIDWRGNSGNGSGSGSGVVDLLVDITPRLVEQSDEVLFRVTASHSAYWRLASLARFDGTTWHVLDENTEETERPVPYLDTVPSDAPVIRVQQDYEIDHLSGQAMPAAVHPMEIANVTALAGVQTGDLSLANGELTAGTSYQVNSAVPNPTYDDMRGAAVGSLDSQDPVYFGTPQLPKEVHQLLEDWTRPLPTPFMKLVAIQNRLRGFTYSTDISTDNGASTDYLTKFLLETQRGFCQQFATAFAILARELGYPSRVSVGFLPGSATDAPDGQTYEVRGTDAHAWPEVYFEKFGWIAFDPTPRPQGMTARPAYTIPPLPTGVLGVGGASEPGGPARGAAGTAPKPGLANRLRDPITFLDRTKTTRPVDDLAWRATFGRVIAVLITALLLWLVVIPLLKAGRGWRLTRKARTPTDAAVAHFERFEIDAGDFGSPRSPAESPRQFAARLARTETVDLKPARRLATLFEGASYSAGGAEPSQAGEAERLARNLRRSLWRRASLLSRARALWGPRTLLPARGQGFRRWVLRSARG